MAVAAGIMVPHPPLIVPDVGRGQEILIKDTIKAYQEAAGMAAELKPDTLVVISPHAVMYADYFHVSPGKEARGDFGRCMAPQIGVEAGYDEAFVRELDRLCGDDDFPMGEERRKGIELDFAVGQVHDVTRDLSDEEASRLIVAYEPIWAIGSGMVATPQSAQDAAKAIRDDLAETFGTHVGESVRILYGGSVSSKNAEELIGEPDVDGFLIGGAALNVDELTRICQLTMNATV